MKESKWNSHLLFWFLYFLIVVYNEVFLSSSFASFPFNELVLKASLAQACLLPVKIGVVYYALYSLIPRWLKSLPKTRLLIESILVFIAFILLYRFIIQFIVWPYISKSSPQLGSMLQDLARFFYSCLDVLQVVGIAAAIKLFRLRIEAIKNEKLLIQEKLQSEILHLKSQVNPHFLFNSLNSIYALSRKSSDMTPDAVLSLSNILRYMLYESEKKRSTIGDELKIIDHYIELQQLRFGNKVHVKITKKVDDPLALITPLLILPLLENAFKYGIGNHQKDSFIYINISLIEENFQVNIRNAIEDPSLLIRKEAGIGISNIKRQLELLYRQFTFHHGAENGWYNVSLTIQLSGYVGFELFNSGR